MGWISDKLLSFIESIAIKVKVWAWHRRVNRLFIKRYKNERHKNNRKVLKDKRTKD